MTSAVEPSRTMNQIFVETSYLQSDGQSAMGDDTSAQQFSQNGIDV